MPSFLCTQSSTQISTVVPIPNSLYNPKPATNHSCYLPCSSSSYYSKKTTNLSSSSSSSSSSGARVYYRNRGGIIRASSETMATEKLGIKIVKNPPESKLTDLGVRSWPKWGCPPSKFPWTYSSKETCFLLKGKVKVYPEGSDEAVEFGAGDLVELMSCTWDVSETVDKHYQFE